ncbi:Phage portal protein, SPP1 Gp6-like [Terribacillus halophilus]|uniref:Phage portal protein, SPP1 Gp6-like n=1 Tax=Terribacillus halophilus TaxID=361279 RepID=A0A1G6PNC0_9BACI|nr:phage portal protein [Terribacillus halophilus]SDC80835.1 Phage portal protein, SPP1 Gp6-like [Terribacillus halophilus]
MTELHEYIAGKYESSKTWFVEEVGSIQNQQRLLDINEKKDYLDGQHKIIYKPSYKYNGKDFEPRKIVLQYAKTLLNFQKAFLLQKPITFTGNEHVVKKYQSINKKGKYNRFDQKVLDKILKYGECAEYVYMENKVIKSKLIPADQGFPVYDENNDLIAFIEAFIYDAISYYIVYEKDFVTKYDNNGGDIRLVERRANLSGLPIVYSTDNELDDTKGRSELDDWLSILDSMEDLISKYADSFYKFMNPIPVVIGQQLKGEAMPSHIVGGGLQLDDGSEFKMESNGLDYKSFESLYKTLLQSLLDTSQTPAVSMNKTDISNLSEVSIKLLFQLAEIKAGINEQYMREGFEQRFDKIRTLLELQGEPISDEEYESLDIVFQFATPQNDKEIIENIAQLRELGGMSLESLLEKSPYTSDVRFEMERLQVEGKGKEEKDKSVNNNQNVNEKDYQLG